MTLDIDIAWWEGVATPAWDHGAAHVLPDRIDRAATALDALVAEGSAPWVLLWDPVLGEPDEAVLADLAADPRVDAWHAGIALGLGGLPDEHDYVHPTWPLTVDPGADEVGVCWRLSLAACLVRRTTLATLGGLDPAYEGSTGAGLDLGRRLITRGAVPMHAPALVGDRRMRSATLTEHDRALFLRRTFGAKWVTYAAARRVLAGHSPLAVGRALRASGRSAATTPRPAPDAIVERPGVPVEGTPRVAVVMPTLGRPDLARNVLQQLRVQTVPPVKVIVVDQNDDHDDTPYEGLEPLPLEVVHQDAKGQWIARNEGIRRIGDADWVGFIDDDSDIGPDFIEQHLEGLQRYGADLSTGASLAAVGAPVPDHYAHFHVADQWDSGNGMCHRSLIAELGMFDQQFDRQRRGDAEFGLRAQRAGRLVVHNPNAIRHHSKAATGGLRVDGSWDGLRVPDRSAPLPQPSLLYYAARYHTPRQAREDLMLGVALSAIPYHLKRRVGPARYAGLLAREALHLPSLVRRVRKSRAAAARMVAEGPRIPRFDQ